jgi:hypothetical protein
MSSSKKRASKGIETDFLLADEVSCPVCSRVFVVTEIEEHVERCLFLNSPSSSALEPQKDATNSSTKQADTGSFLLAKRAKHAEKEPLTQETSNTPEQVCTKSKYLTGRFIE